MKHFLIRYTFGHGTPEAWHREIQAFIAALDADPELHGKIAYRAIRIGDGPDYMHLATAADETAVKLIGSKAFFERYTEATEAASAGGVEVTPLTIVAQTLTPI